MNHMKLLFFIRTAPAVSLSEDEQAVSGMDYMSKQASIYLGDGVSSAPIKIIVLAVSQITPLDMECY